MWALEEVIAAAAGQPPIAVESRSKKIWGSKKRASSCRQVVQPKLSMYRTAVAGAAAGWRMRRSLVLTVGMETAAGVSLGRPQMHSAGMTGQVPISSQQGPPCKPQGLLLCLTAPPHKAHSTPSWQMRVWASLPCQ